MRSTNNMNTVIKFMDECIQSFPRKPYKVDSRANIMGNMNSMQKFMTCMDEFIHFILGDIPYKMDSRTNIRHSPQLEHCNKTPH